LQLVRWTRTLLQQWQECLVQRPVLPTPVAIYIAAEVYLMKVPRLLKKLRVMVGWTLDLFFSRDTEQNDHLGDVEARAIGRPDSRARGTFRCSALFFRSALPLGKEN